MSSMRRCNASTTSCTGENLELIRPPEAEAVTVEVFARWLHGELAEALRGTGAEMMTVRVYENADAFGGFGDRLD